MKNNFLGRNSSTVPPLGIKDNFLSNNYRKGATYEYACKTKLETQGYTVLRTAGSHGFADLIAIKPSDGQQLNDRILFIQCKTNPMTRRDYAELKQLERHLGVKIEVWVKHWKRRRFRTA